MATIYARVPDELHGLIRARAAASSTSITREVRQLLELALEVEQIDLRGYSLSVQVLGPVSLANLAQIVRYGGYRAAGERSILHLGAPPGHSPSDITVEYPRATG